MKIKDNLDLQGYLLQNFCVDNYDSLDSISNKGDGRMVFLTGNSTDAKYRHVNVWDGTNFKALAYLEDVAMNDDFIALQEKVALLAGDVDTDAIISNMKEVSAFLEGFAEDASLMDYLTSELGKKLDKSGGTIEGGYDTLTIKRNSSYASLIRYANADGVMGYLGFSNENIPAWYPSDLTTSYILLHSGNVGEYKSGDSDMLGGVAASRYFLRNSSITSDTIDADTWGVFGFARLANNGGAALNWPESYGYTLNYKGHEANRAGFQLFAKASGNSLLFRRHWDSWGDWKTIAFTDSNENITFANEKGVAGTTVEGQKYTMLYLSNANNLLLGFHTSLAGISTKINGKNVYLNYGENHTTGILLNSSGNVTIGASDLAGTSAKLYVNGGIRFAPRTIWGQSFDGTGNIEGNILNVTLIRFKDSGIYGIYRGMDYSSNLTANDLAYVSIQHAFYTSSYQRLFINQYGNVTIGASDLAGTSAKLYVDGGVILPNNSYIGSELPDTNKTKVNLFGLNSNKMLLVGYDIKTIGATRIYGTSIEFAPNGTATKMLINSAGNVGIGTTDPQHKLDVNGSGRFGRILINKGYGSNVGEDTIEMNTAGATLWMQYYHNGSINMCSGGGNVLIGATEDNGAKLQVAGDISSSANIKANRSISLTRGGNAFCGLYANNVVSGSDESSALWLFNETQLYLRGASIGLVGGTTIIGNLHVTGNIIADKEVSAGGAAEEGGNAGGGGAFHSEGIAVGATQTTIAHGLGTDDIVVSIYEKDATSGLWSMILTDIEITDANNIRVTFGSATTVEHKVVIMGAVA